MSLLATQATRVLVVEDDALLGAVVKDILEDDGLAVTVLAPASPAVLHDAVRRWEPACILLDGAGRTTGARGATRHSCTALRRPLP